MALDAGEVFVICGAKLDSSSIARGHAALKSLESASNDYQKAITRGEEASNRLHTANERWTRAAVVGAKASAIGIGTVTAALAGAAVAAASFDSSMRNVNSIAGLSEKGFRNLEAQVLRLSTAVGKSPKDLADGLYSIVSSGFKAQDAMKILTAGARAARAGLTDTATATGALTSVLNAYGLKAGDARKVSDVLFQTVNVGVLNFQQLAGALGKVLSPAASIGVSLKDLSGAMAALTLRGNSADEAATQLGQTMLALQKPGPALTKVLKGLGYESGTAAIKAVGFKGTLDEIVKAANKAGVPLAQLFSNVRALRGVQGLEGTAHAAAVFTASVKSMNDATKGAGETAKVYAEQQKSTSAQFDHLKAAVDVAAVTIGTALLPQINAGIGALTKWLAAAQRSGELSQWAHTIAHDVSEVVTFLHSLGPAASQAFHVIVSTVQSAIPFVEALLHALQAIEPELSAVAHAAEGLAGALGPGPILAAVAAFLALRRATLTGQVAVGGFAKVMQAGEKAIGTAGDGALLTSGKFNRIGAEAIKSSSAVKIAARGIASSFGPQLIAAGVAGIVLGIVAIRNSMTDLKHEAQDVVDAIAEIQGDRLDVAAARIAKARADAQLVVAQKTAGSRAVDVRDARTTQAASTGEHGQGGLAPSPAVIKATNDLAKANLNVADATNQRNRADQVLAAAAGKKVDDTTKLSQQLVGLGQKAREATQHHDLTTDQATGGRFGPDALTAVQRQQRAVDAFVKSLRDAAAADKSLDAAAKGAANRVADTIKALNLAHPTNAQFKIIADDVAAGKSLKAIKRDLGILDKTIATPKINADPSGANRDIDNVTGKANALDALRPKVHLSTSGFDGVRAAISGINANILHLTSTPFTVKVNEAAGRTGHFNAQGKWVYAAQGHRTKQGQAELAVIGEGAAPEYVIPTERAHRASGIALWMQAAKDLGISGYKAGVRKPGKTPPPIQRGLGYDPAALDAQASNEHTRLENARKERDTLAGRLKTDGDHYSVLEGEIATAKKAMGSKNKKAAAAAKTRHSALTSELARLKSRMTGETNAWQRLVGTVIPADTKRYQQATAAAKIGDEHASEITKWQDRADADTAAMSTASAQWDAADRKNDPKGRAKAYADWDSARKSRVTDLGQVKKLLEEVMKVVGKTDYGAKITGQLSSVIGDIVQAQDDTQAPGYVDPNTPASTDINDYLYQSERDALAQAAFDMAKAASTDDTSDDVAAAHEELGVASWIRDRLVQDGAPIDILTQAYQAVASANSDLASAVQGNAPGGATSGVTADQQAVLDQQKQIATSSQANADSAAAALTTFQSSLDLVLGRGGGTTINVGVRALTADSASVQRKVGEEVARAWGAQPGPSSSTGAYRG